MQYTRKQGCTDDITEENFRETVTPAYTQLISNSEISSITLTTRQGYQSLQIQTLSD